jgi:hypothetical protein
MNKSKQRLNLNRSVKTFSCEGHKSDHSGHSALKFETIGLASRRFHMKYRATSRIHERRAESEIGRLTLRETIPNHMWEDGR